MKYRVQFNAVFNNNDSNDILNNVESVKSDVFSPSEFTQVETIKDSKKCNTDNENETIYSSVDFEAVQATHTDEPSGCVYFKTCVDISFSDELKFNTFLNYLETIKNKANASYIRSCRWFECMHDETPLQRDGPYSYMDFDSAQATH